MNKTQKTLPIFIAIFNQYTAVISISHYLLQFFVTSSNLLCSHSLEVALDKALPCSGKNTISYFLHISTCFRSTSAVVYTYCAPRRFLFDLSRYIGALLNSCSFMSYLLFLVVRSSQSTMLLMYQFKIFIPTVVSGREFTSCDAICLPFCFATGSRMSATLLT